MGLNEKFFASAAASDSCATSPVQLSPDLQYYGVRNVSCSGNPSSISGRTFFFGEETEGQVIFNHNTKTTGKWYIEAEFTANNANNGALGVFKKSGNNDYNVALRGKNPLDADYGLVSYFNGKLYYDGVNQNLGTSTLGFTYGANNVQVLAFDADLKKVWFGRRSSTSSTTVVWGTLNGTVMNPEAGTGGFSVSYDEFDLIGFHASAAGGRKTQMVMLSPTEIITPPTGFCYLGSDFTASGTSFCG